MINAAEALRLSRHKGEIAAQGNKILAEIESAIKSAADMSRTKLELGNIIQTTAIHHDERTQFKVDEVKRYVVAILRDLGFKVDYFQVGMPYVPRGWQDDDGNGPQVTVWNLVIDWSDE